MKLSMNLLKKQINPCIIIRYGFCYIGTQQEFGLTEGTSISSVKMCSNQAAEAYTVAEADPKVQCGRILVFIIIILDNMFSRT